MMVRMSCWAFGTYLTHISPMCQGSSVVAARKNLPPSTCQLLHRCSSSASTLVTHRILQRDHVYLQYAVADSLFAKQDLTAVLRASDA